MKRTVTSSSLLRAAVVVSSLLLGISTAQAQRTQTLEEREAAASRAQFQEQLKWVLADKPSYVREIVQRWAGDARASGKWDKNLERNLYASLLKLQPGNLIAAAQAGNYAALMRVLAAGASSPDFGEATADLVFTPITPCRIVDTRIAGGALSANVTRTLDADGSTFSAQGGVNASCGIPLGVARNVAMTITVTNTSGSGYLYAWGMGARPNATVLNFFAGQTIANTTLVPIVPGGGNDFSVQSLTNTDVVIDVVGYFAAPVATALDCQTVTSALTSVANNVWTAIDATCPAGYVVTGGGFDVPEGTMGRPQVWVDSQPASNTTWRNWVDNQAGGNRSVQTFARCCRVPGR